MKLELFSCVGSGNCFKARLALRQLNKKFETRFIDVRAGEQKSPEFLEINSLGVVPFLRTESGVGIGESNAMLWYIAEGINLMRQEAIARWKASVEATPGFVPLSEMSPQSHVAAA